MIFFKLLDDISALKYNNKRTKEPRTTEEEMG